MAVLSRDTERRAELIQIEVMRKLSPWRKLELVDEACRATDVLLLAGLRARRPDLDAVQLHWKHMQLLHGDKTAEIWGTQYGATV